MDKDLITYSDEELRDLRDIKVTFLGHSGFLLEFPDLILVFDYYIDPAGILPQYREDPRPLVFLVSHFHPDHLNPEIFDFKRSLPTFYIIDNTSRIHLKRQLIKETEETDSLPASAPRSPHRAYAWAAQPDRKVYVLRPGEEGLPAFLQGTSIQQIQAFPSTDVGNSYLLTTPEGLFFHAGDLNDWDFQEENSPEMEKSFRAIIRQLARHIAGVPLTLCLFPVDERLGDRATKGAAYLLEHITCEHFGAMHNFGENQVQKHFLATLPPQILPPSHFWPNAHPGDSFTVAP